MKLSNTFSLKSRVATSFNIGGVSSLLHWFKFNEGQTVTGSNTVSQWIDQSGSNRNLVQSTASKQPPVATSGVTGHLDFSGSTTQMLLEADGSASQMALVSFTICFAFLPGSYNVETILGNLNTSGILLRLGQSNNDKKIRLQLIDSGTFTHDITLAESLPAVGTEYVLTITRDTSNTDNEVKVFVNNTLKSTSTFTGAGTQRFIVDKIGSHAGQSNPFDGSIHEFVVFNSVLDSTTLDKVIDDIKDRNSI